jgi:NADH dehydrogenase FAD-containing subunit
MKKRILVLGAGFGGLELCTMLSEAFGDAIEVTLIEKTQDKYVPVKPRTLETRFPGVYAVGDCARQGTPKADVFA